MIEASLGPVRVIPVCDRGKPWSRPCDSSVWFLLQDWEHRREEDRLLIERLLIIIRNILHVPPNVTQELVRFCCLYLVVLTLSILFCRSPF